MNLVNTNITSIKTGRGCTQNIGFELGSFIVTTMEIPWNVTRNAIGKNLRNHMTHDFPSRVSR